MNASTIIIILCSTIINCNINVINNSNINQQSGLGDDSCSYVAELSIFSYYSQYYISSDIDIGGHAFITLTNYRKEPICFGKMILNNDETVSLGNYGNISSHKGTIYNLDSYKVNQLGEMKGRVSLSMGLNLDQLIKLNLFINGHDSWSITYNCSSFAQEAWNLVSDDKVTAHEDLNYLVYKPEILVNSIMKYSYYKTDKYIHNNIKIGYYNNNEFISISEN